MILLRHAESLGNVDELAYTRIPDHALPLTEKGRQEALAVAPEIVRLLGGARPAVYVSPYSRTRETLRLLDIRASYERLVPEPRLREQDWATSRTRPSRRSRRRGATSSATSSTGCPSASRARTSTTASRRSSRTCACATKVTRRRC